MFKYLMLSAYTGFDSAPDGFSATEINPFQATPFKYPPCPSDTYNTPLEIPVSKNF